MWPFFTVVGLIMGSCLIEAFNLGGTADRAAARNRERGGSRWVRRPGERLYDVRPTTPRGVRLTALLVLVVCAALVLVLAG